MIINNRIIPGVGGGISTTPGSKGAQTSSTSKTSFEELFSKEIYKSTDVKFSKHAEERLKSREINITEEQKDKLNEAINKANDKNVKDSLVMVEDLAFVVNVKNKTVITALNKDEMKENVFTNIDGAVIA